MRNGAGFVPQEDFYLRLKRAEQGEKGLSIIPYEILKVSTSGVISVDSALEHPMVLPFLGVDEAKARNYLEKHKNVYGPNIGVRHSDDFVEGEVRGRLLFLRGSYFDYLLLGDYDLDLDARFVGVREKIAEGGDAKKSCKFILQRK